MEKYFVVLDMMYEWYGPEGRMPQHPTRLTVMMLDQIRGQFGHHPHALKIIESWKKNRKIDESKQETIKEAGNALSRDVW